MSIVQTLACNLQKSFQTSVRVKQKLFSSRQWLRIIVAYLLLVIVKWKDTMRVHNKNKFNKESSAFITRQLLDIIKRKVKELSVRHTMFLHRKI